MVDVAITILFIGALAYFLLYEDWWMKKITLKRRTEIDRLNYLLRKEEAPGIHTYHTCPHCNKNGCRFGKCAECLKKDLEKL